MVVDRRLLFAAVLFLSFLLVACSESDNDDDDDTLLSKNPEHVLVGEVAQLTAFTSDTIDDDLDRNDLTFLWQLLSKPEGSKATLSDPESPKPTFIPDVAGTYVLKLSIFYKGEPLTELEIAVEALPQEPDTDKPDNHIASDDNCSACHLPDSWLPATVDHDHVIGACSSCHRLPAGHVPTAAECNDCHDTETWGADRAMLMLSKALWERSNITQYQFRYSCSCSPADDLLITVVDGVVIEAFYASSGDMVPEQDLMDLITVNRLFDIIEDAIDAGSMLTVTYNIDFGYPQIAIIGDTDKSTHTIMDFEVIETPPANPDQVQLDENIALWQQANMRDYQYTYNVSCFLCDVEEDIVVVVNAGQVVNAYYTPSGTPLTPEQIQRKNLGGIEQLFATIQLEIDRPATSLDVTYNGLLGYPEAIFIDPSADMFDDQYTILVSSVTEPTEPPRSPAQIQLDENMILWQEAAIADYQYTYQISCFCIYRENVVVVVRGGVIVEAYFTPSGTPLTPAEIENYQLKTVEQLFTVIQDEIDRPAAQLDVTYNSMLGYPQVISVDQHRQIADDEYVISVLDFEEIIDPPVNPQQELLEQNKALWTEAGLAEYQFTYNISCFLCDIQEDIVVIVNTGDVVEAYYTPSGTALTPDEIQRKGLGAVEHYFELIQAEIDRPAVELIVRYHETLGYPLSITVDPLEELYDDRYTMTLSDLKEPVKPPENPAQVQLDANMALWQQAGIANYRYIYHLGCFCPYQEDIVIVVRLNKVVEAYFTPSGVPLTPAQIESNNLRTIDELHTVIQNAIDRPAAELNVTYNAQSGYPEMISVDPYAELVDDQYTITVSDFQELVEPSPNDPRQAQLNENLALWQQAGISKYQFTYRAACLCPPEEDAVLTVENGVIIEAHYTPSNTPLTPQQIAYKLTIEDIFNVIQDAIDQKAYMMNITYNQQLGYPELTSIDYVQMIADEEIYYLVMDFQSLM